MLHFTKGTIGPWLKKEWFWFEDPREVVNAAWIFFFSYNHVNAPGFKITEGHTSIINLDKNVEELWGNIREKYSRLPIEEGMKNGITVKEDRNFKAFNEIYKEFRKVKKLSTDDYSLFKNGILFSAYYNEEMMAGHIFLADGHYMRSWVTASKRFGAQSGKERRIVGQANRMLIWEALKYAKGHGYKIFDLGGINPDSTKPEELSLIEFKESFGGQRIKNYYYVKVYSPWLKAWHRLRRLISK